MVGFIHYKISVRSTQIYTGQLPSNSDLEALIVLVQNIEKLPPQQAENVQVKWPRNYKEDRQTAKQMAAQLVNLLTPRDLLPDLAFWQQLLDDRLSLANQNKRQRDFWEEEEKVSGPWYNNNYEERKSRQTSQKGMKYDGPWEGDNPDGWEESEEESEGEPLATVEFEDFEE
jgi:hypothetical protein